jgi:hypothetical protein
MNDPLSQADAPSKKKSTLRRSLTVVAALVVLLVIAHSVASFITGRNLARTLERVNAAWGPLTAASLAPPPVPDRENRAKPLQAAIALLTLDQQQGALMNNLRTKSFDELSEKELSQIDELLRANRQSVELLQDAAARPRANWGISYGQTGNIDLDSFISLLKLFKLNHARLLVALRTGDEQRAAASMREGFAMAESLAQEPNLPIQMIRMAGNRQNVRLVQLYLSFGLMGDAQLNSLDEAIARSLQPVPMQHALKGELAMYSEWYREMGDLLPQRQSFPSGMTMRGMLLLARPDIRADFRRYFETMDQLIESARQAPYLQPDLKTIRASLDQGPKIRHFSSAMIIPNILDAFSKRNQEQGRVALARTAVAIRRHQLATGELPSQLEELAPDYLAEPPIDPFSGDLLQYEVSGDSFTLRSTGADINQDPPPRNDPLLQWKLPILPEGGIEIP